MVFGFNDERPLKRAKKRRLSRTAEDLPDFFAFPSPADQTTASQPFRDNVKSFLSCHARLTLPPSLFPSLLTWRVTLRLEDPDLLPSVVVLDVVEEDVTSSRRSVYCDHCRVVGESTHRLSFWLPEEIRALFFRQIFRGFWKKKIFIFLKAETKKSAIYFRGLIYFG